MMDVQPQMLSGWPEKAKNQADTSRDRFRQNLARIMADRGITQAGLARTMDVSRVAVHAWIWGTCFPETSRLLKLAQSLGVQVGTLLEGEPDSGAELDAPSEETMLLEAFRKLPITARSNLLADVHQQSMRLTRCLVAAEPTVEA